MAKRVLVVMNPFGAHAGRIGLFASGSSDALDPEQAVLAVLDAKPFPTALLEQLLALRYPDASKKGGGERVFALKPVDGRADLNAEVFIDVWWTGESLDLKRNIARTSPGRVAHE